MGQGETEPLPGATIGSPGRTIFALVGGAIAWVLHFLGSYAVIAIGCVERWNLLVAVVAIGTLMLLGVAIWSTVAAWRAWRGASRGQRWDDGLTEPPGWFAWLMMVGVLVGATATLTILLEAAGALFLPACGWDVR